MKKTFFILSVMSILISCKNSEKEDQLNPLNESNSVKSETIQTVAKNFDSYLSVITSKDGSKNARIGNTQKTIKTITPVKDSKNNPLYYVINYVGGGFVLVSAEKKTMPILAFSETDPFPVDQELPNGVTQLIQNYKDDIIKARVSDLPATEIVTKEWEKYENSDAVAKWVRAGNKTAKVLSEPENPGCQDSQIYVAPLLTTSWGQGCAYNSQMPSQAAYPVYAPCSWQCGKAATGCVATAMAQIMNFHHFPNTFNWATVLPYYDEMGRLMRSAANSVSTTYNCDGSGAYATAIRGGFLSYGYSSILSHQSFNASNLLNDLVSNHRPALISGANSTYAHAWVCDGVLQIIGCQSNNGPMFHMNWGFDGSYNGFFYSNNLSATGGTDYFNTNMTMEINITH